ncbi:hypothetical protein E6A52_12180, partial [Brachyspira hampsonii]|nr:hypothetical protein [Brachyspira hampsonii]
LHEISLVTFPAYPQTNVRHKGDCPHSANEDVYIPKPPAKTMPTVNDDFDYRNKEYEQKIKYLKIKNK